MKSEFIYTASLKNLSVLAKDLEDFCAKCNASDTVSYAFALCLDELFTNVVSYGFCGGSDDKIELELSSADGVMTAEMSDAAKPFDPFTQAAQPDINCSLENRDIGGLGIFFIKKTMDEVSYKYEGGRNIVRLTKKMEGALAR